MKHFIRINAMIPMNADDQRAMEMCMEHFIQINAMIPVNADDQRAMEMISMVQDKGRRDALFKDI
jgi:hypothetical protein